MTSQCFHVKEVTIQMAVAHLSLIRVNHVETSELQPFELCCTASKITKEKPTVVKKDSLIMQLLKVKGE